MINVYEFLRYQPELYKQFICKDLMIVYYDCPQVVRSVDVFTHYNILSFVIDGRKLMHRPEQTMLLEKDHCYFLKIGAYNQELYLDDGWRSMNLYISNSYLQQLIKAYRREHPGMVAVGQPFGQITELKIDQTTRGLAGQMLACFSEEITPTEACLEQRFRCLFQSLLANPANQGLVAHLSRLARCPDTSLHDVMESNFMYNLSLTEFSQLANRSLPTFKREFKRMFHTTPSQWLMQKRLTHAKVLLKTTEKSIGDIVQESGFESDSHFSRVFKNKFGEAPHQYRKQLILR